MSIAKLYLFKKDTDASASMRGYQYQVFKTLETWLDNYLTDVDDEIYCDYEEDIFQHNELTQAAIFRQLKLYSSNFSFKSDEIRKAIAHFFMLHVKTDYADKNKEFVFEANSRIADFREGNKTDLLRQWVANQADLPDALLTECSKEVKAIVADYVQTRSKDLTEQLTKRLEKSVDDQQQLLAIHAEEQVLQEALAIFGQLTDADWDVFTRNIKWQFEDVAPDVAFANTISHIEQQIAALPFDIPTGRQQGLFGVLCKRVVIKASEQDPQNRKLIREELTGLILQSGTEEEQWYQEVFAKWTEIGSPIDFRIGEFYEVLKAVKFCRWSKTLVDHDGFWAGLLDWYIMHLSERPAFKKNAIYERLMLQLRPMEYLAPPTGDLFGHEDQLRAYFSDFSGITEPADFEDNQSLLFIALATAALEKSALSMEEATEWLRQYNERLDEKIAGTSNPSELCRLLESKFSLRFIASGEQRTEEKIAKILAPLEDLLLHLNGSALYNATQLSGRLHKYIELLIEQDAEKHEPFIEALREYVNRLDEFVEKKVGAHQAARKRIAEGVKYLQTTSPTSLLKALTSFHEAKDRWLQAETFEGYALALLNIAQVYSALGMNMAAKYYALWAAWVSVHKGSRDLVKRIAQGYGIAFHADFKQGAWMSALLDFERFILARHQFDTEPLDAEEAEMPRKVLANYGLLLYAAPILAPQLNVLVEAKLTDAGYLREEYLAPVIQMLQDELPAPKLQEALALNLTDSPLYDLGPERFIRFQALGIDWTVSFQNTYQLTALGEDFCALLQILLAEIALSKVDFHLTKGTVDITLEVSEQITPPEQLRNNIQYAWQVFVQQVESTDQEVVKMGVAQVTSTLMSILQEISLLPAEEFKAAFFGLFEKNKLAAKTLQATSYQRMYRLLFPELPYQETQRHAFTSVAGISGLPAENEVMPWRADISAKYRATDIQTHIDNRFTGTHHNIYITLGNLKKQTGYAGWLQSLRADGWQDWQIVLAMMNFMVGYKVNLAIANKNFATDEDRFQAMKTEFARIARLDEKDCMVQFPLEAFHMSEFKHHLKTVLISALPSFGLESKSRFPNFNAVKEFLQIRFNMLHDTNDAHNPLL